LMVAAKLEILDVPEWVSKELSGYTDHNSLPSYRTVHGRVMTRNWGGGWLPVQFPTNELQNQLSEQAVYASAAELEGLSKQDGKLRFGFAPELQQLLQTAFQHDSEFACFIERARLDAILDEIRNRVLHWAIALDKAGIRGAGLSFTGEEKERAHHVVFHADSGHISVGVVGNVGGHAQVATGLQPTVGTIDAEDIKNLLSEITAHIASLKLQPIDRGAVQAALSELTSDQTTSVEPSRVREALTRVLGVIGKAGETVLTAGIKACTEEWMKLHGMAP
jgi:hypothetical protein